MRALALLALLLTPLASAAPEQVHLGIPDADATTTRSILWLELDPAAPPATVTLEGPDGTREVAGVRVEGPSLGAAYEARLDGLVPDAVYTYTLGGREFLFGLPAEDPYPIRVVALGDMGVNARSAETVRVIEKLFPDVILHMGDISYAEGRQNEWIDWFRMVEPVAAEVPWMTALGNHETYTGASPWALSGEPSPLEIAFYKQRFGLPGNEIWYSFDIGDVHFVALDTFSQRSIAKEQVEWLEADLAASDATWKIAFLHEPPWSSNSHGSSERVQDAFGPLFEKHGVQLVLAGHDHGYERTREMGGVTYVVSGGGGESLYAEWEEPAPEWSVKRGSDYHVLLLQIWPDRIEGSIVPTQGGDLADKFSIRGSDTAGAPAAVATSDVPFVTPFVGLTLVALAAFAFARRR